MKGGHNLSGMIGNDSPFWQLTNNTKLAGLAEWPKIERWRVYTPPSLRLGCQPKPAQTSHTDFWAA